MQNPRGSSLTTDFHLRLSELESQQKKILKQYQEHEQQLLYTLQAMPISISPKQSMIYFSLFLLWFLHLVIFYIKKYNQISKQSSVPSLTKIHDAIFSNPLYGYIINGFLMALIIFVVVFYHLKAKDGCLYYFSQTANRLYPYLRFIIKAVFFLSCFFAQPSDISSITLFILGSFITIFSAIFLQNLTLRKDEFCCKSLQFSVILRTTMIISLAIDLISVKNVSNWNSFLLISSSQLILSINLIICYFKIGITIYRHICARTSMLLLIILYHSLSLALCIDIIATEKYAYYTTNVYLIALAIFIVVSMLIYSTYCRIRKQSTFPTNQNIRQKIYFMFNKFEQADMDEEIDCEIRGIIHDHYYEDCRNLECIVNIKQAYDSKKRKVCSIHRIAQGKTSVVKFYIKCLYQTQMLTNYSRHFQLDFLQFHYLKLKNVYGVQRKIVQIQRNYMTFYQKLRLIRLKSHLIDQSNKFSSELFNKSLSMEDVIEHQKRFSKVQSIIQLIICRNELFWKYLQSSQIHLKQILDVIRPNFNLMNILNKQWEEINHYFHINRRWKFYYICYNIFVKNEKIKPSMIEDFGNSVDYDSIFKTQNYFVDKTTEKEQLFNPIMLFQQNTCFIHAICDDDKMTITKVSNFFQKNFQYEDKQAIHSPISILMAPSIRAAHHKKFLSWIKQQKSNNEAYYQVKKIYPLTKKGYIYPCFKFYKRYIKLNGEIQYIAMLKSNKKDEQIILMNKNFQIQAITGCLHQKLKMHGGDYIYLQGINLLALMPSLIKYTRFGSEIREDDEDFFENDENLGYLKKQSTYTTQKEGDDKQGNDMLSQKKNISLSNIKFYFPNNLQQGLQLYKKSLHRKKGEVTFQTIRQLFKFLKKSKNYCKFKAELIIRQRDMQGSLYYELQINQIEESNRLQKLDQEEQKKQGSQICLRSNDDNRQYNEIDMELFFSLSKKKHKVMLFPSKNIFLKDEHNKALTQIPHINNISFFMRISLFFLILFVILQIVFQTNMVSTFSDLTIQFEELAIHQKTAHMLNNQYNIQHIQPGNYWQQSFIIIAYTHILIKNYESQYFQKIIYDKELNSQQLCDPYYPYINSPPLNNFKQYPLDQVSIFFKIYQSAISLHREAEIDPWSTLQMLQYYEFTNYIEPFQQKVNKIKDNIIAQFDTNYSDLMEVNRIFVFVTSGIILCSLIFSFSRLLKVYRGFKELVSILIQIDNSDIKSISRYVDYTKYLFERINNKYYQMGSHSESNSASSSNFRSFQKKSSQLQQQQQQKMGSTEANLNKKIKKMQIGSTITKMMLKPSAILLCIILLIGAITLTLNTYAIITLNQYADFQKLGFEFFRNFQVSNILATGALEKFRNSTLYQFEKYQKYINLAVYMQSTDFEVKMNDQASQFENLVKKLYQSNFCRELSYILNETLTAEFEDICDLTNAGWCSQIFFALSQNNLIKRCETIQNGQMGNGLKNYNNFFLGQVVPYLKDEGGLSLNNAVELNDAFKNIDYILLKLIEIWRIQSINKFQSRNHIIVFISIGIIGLTILLIIILIQVYIVDSLNNIYEIFREMHEHYIPQWLINKQKIIKAKLVNQGFMKQ